MYFLCVCEGRDELCILFWGSLLPCRIWHFPLASFPYYHLVSQGHQFLPFNPLLSQKHWLSHTWSLIGFSSFARHQYSDILGFFSVLSHIQWNFSFWEWMSLTWGPFVSLSSSRTFSLAIGSCGRLRENFAGIWYLLFLLKSNLTWVVFSVFQLWWQHWFYIVLFAHLVKLRLLWRLESLDLRGRHCFWTNWNYYL